MEVLYACCCGLDVHKKSITACCRWQEPGGKWRREIRKFGTYSSQLRQMSTWLRQVGVEQVAMESTGSYWRPVWNILEAEGMPMVLANPQQVRKAPPGRKTDVKDPEWISDLAAHGLIAPSFVPNRHMRELRDLTRMRSKVVQDHTRVVNRLQALLEDANIKLSSVVTDILGVSSRAMLQGLLEGRAAAELAELARGKLRARLEDLREALDGEFRREHAFLLKRLLMQLRFLENQEKALRSEIERRLSEEEKQAIELWDTIPGVNQAVAWTLVAEMGVNPDQFPDAHHFASWAGVCPGNNESGGRQHYGRTRKANSWLKAALCEAAWSASRAKDSYLAAQFRRMVTRKGRKRAIVAVAHSIAVAAYQMLKNHQPWSDLGADYFDRTQPDKTADRLLQRLSKMGYDVSQIRKSPETK